MRLMAAFWEGAQLRLQFEVDDGSEQLSRWEMTFEDVLNSTWATRTNAD